MDHHYNLDSPADVAPLGFANWIKSAEEVLHSTKWCTKHISVKAVRELFPSITAVDTGHAYTYAYADHIAIRWHALGSVTEVIVVHTEIGEEGVLLLKAKFPPVHASDYVKWFYADANGPKSVELELKGAGPEPAFYPWINDLGRLYSDFVSSTANVMLLIGPPGTGKTTFIRGLLRSSKMQAWVTYDEAVQRDERLYVKFAGLQGGDESYDDDGYQLGKESDEGRILVMEDADDLLESRRDGNKLMGRLLNLSDGLASMPARKLVFSTNLPSLTSVDSALRRPGRCFAAVNFRPLTAKEAGAACKAIGLNKTFKEPCTLSEALNDQSEFNAEVVRKIGFG